METNETPLSAISYLRSIESEKERNDKINQIHTHYTRALESLSDTEKNASIIAREKLIFKKLQEAKTGFKPEVVAAVGVNLLDRGRIIRDKRDGQLNIYHFDKDLSFYNVDDALDYELLEPTKEKEVLKDLFLNSDHLADVSKKDENLIRKKLDLKPTVSIGLYNLENDTLISNDFKRFELTKENYNSINTYVENLDETKNLIENVQEVSILVKFDNKEFLIDDSINQTIENLVSKGVDRTKSSTIDLTIKTTNKEDSFVKSKEETTVDLLATRGENDAIKTSIEKSIENKEESEAIVLDLGLDETIQTITIKDGERVDLDELVDDFLQTYDIDIDDSLYFDQDSEELSYQSDIRTIEESLIYEHLTSETFKNIVGVELTEDDLRNSIDLNYIDVQNITIDGVNFNGRISFEIDDNYNVVNHFEAVKVLSRNPLESDTDFITAFQKEELNKGNLIIVNNELFRLNGQSVVKVPVMDLKSPAIISDKKLTLTERVDLENGKEINIPITIGGETILTRMSNKSNSYKVLMQKNPVIFTNEQQAVLDYKPNFFHFREKKIDELLKVVLIQKKQEVTKENVLKLKNELIGDFNEKGKGKLTVALLKDYYKNEFATMYRLQNEVLFNGNSESEIAISEPQNVGTKNYKLSISSNKDIDIEFLPINEVLENKIKSKQDIDITFSKDGDVYDIKNKTDMSDLTKVDKNNWNELHDKVENNPKEILNIENPPISMAYLAVKGDESLLEQLPSALHRQVLSNPLFKENDFAKEEAKTMFSSQSWSELKTLTVPDPDDFSKKIKVKGKLVYSQFKDKRPKASIVQVNPDKFDIKTDPFGKLIKSDKLQNNLTSGKTVAVTGSKDNKIHFLKYDKQLNRIVEVPRRSIQIAPKVGNYRLTEYDMNTLLRGGKVTGIPLGDANVAIKYDAKRNGLQPASAKDQKAFQEYRAKLGAVQSKTLSVDQAKSLITKLDNGNTADFIKQVKDDKINLSNDFLKVNVMNSKTIKYGDKIKTLKAIGKSDKQIQDLMKGKDKIKDKSQLNTKEVAKGAKSAIKKAVETSKEYSKSQ